MKSAFYLSLVVSFLALPVLGCDKGPKDSGETSGKVVAEAKGMTQATAVTAKKTVAKGKSYGAGVGSEGAKRVSIAELSANPEKFEGQEVQVEGMVTDVCVKRGCWFEMAGENAGEKVRFKVTDGEMVFPVSSKGQKAVAEGTIVTRKLSLEETRAQAAYFAEDAGKEFDPASITEPITSFRIQGKGAVIEN